MKYFNVSHTHIPPRKADLDSDTQACPALPSPNGRNLGQEEGAREGQPGEGGRLSVVLMSFQLPEASMHVWEAQMGYLSANNLSKLVGLPASPSLRIPCLP